jgi:hypothetical protein
MVNPLQVFPFEIWKKIFDYSGVEDVQKFGATCQKALDLVLGYLHSSLDKDRVHQLTLYTPSIYPELNFAYSLKNQFGKNRCYYVKAIDMRHMPGISVKQLNRFMQFFPNISKVNMPQQLSNIEKLSLDSGWQGLSKLTVCKTKACFADALPLNSFRNLRHLKYEDAVITKKNIEEIGRVVTLKTLTIDKPSWGLNDEYLKPLKNLTNLTDFSLMQAETIEGKGFQYLRHLSQLTHVVLCGGTGIQDASLSYFGRLNLQSLNLKGCYSITDLGVKRLERIKTLQELNLSHCLNITNASLQSIGLMTELRALTLSYCFNISDVGLQSLRQLMHLEILDATALRSLTYQGIAYLDQCINMKKIVLRDCEDLTDAVFDVLQKWPKLEELDFSGCLKLTDVGVAKLKHCKNLKIVSCAECPQLTQQIVVGALPADCLILF